MESSFYDLFELMADKYGVLLTESEADEIINVCRNIIFDKQIKAVIRKSNLPPSPCAFYSIEGLGSDITGR